jgi:hypothetical protein
VSAAAVAIVVLVAAVIEITGMAGAIVLLLPFVVLLIVVARVLIKPQPLPQPKSKPSRQSDMMSVIHSEGPAISPEMVEPVADAVAPAPPSQPPAVAVTDWLARIEAAEAAKDLVLVASHYLAFARQEIAGGQPDRAADHLRSSVRASAKGRHASIQAEARLELAELARVAGDLTTACEHWQIARGLFHGLKQAAEVGETEKLMQRHGCPTDWVLNDF